MLTSARLRSSLLAAAGLLKLVAAGNDPSNVYGTVVQQPPSPPPAVINSTSSNVEGELLLDECDTGITVCATTADIKIIRSYTSTKFVTNLHVHESITTLSPSTRTVTQVVVSTETTSVEGQCRETRIYEETTPLIVTVDVNTTTIREFVPIVPTTVITTSWVKHKQTSQCIIRRTSTGLASGPGFSSTATASSSASVQQPGASASSSGSNSNSAQSGAPSAHPPAGHSSGRSRSSSSASSSSSQSSVGSGRSSGASASTSSSSSRSSP